MKKNCKINLWLETELKQAIEKQAVGERISISELCRQRLRENKLLKIEMMLEKILSRINAPKE